MTRKVFLVQVGDSSEWVSRVLRPTRHSIGHFGDGLSRQNARTHNDETRKFNLYTKFNLYETQNLKTT